MAALNVSVVCLGVSIENPIKSCDSVNESSQLSTQNKRYFCFLLFTVDGHLTAAS